MSNRAPFLTSSMDWLVGLLRRLRGPRAGWLALAPVIGACIWCTARTNALMSHARYAAPAEARPSHEHLGQADIEPMLDVYTELSAATLRASAVHRRPGSPRRGLRSLAGPRPTPAYVSLIVMPNGEGQVLFGLSSRDGPVQRTESDTPGHGKASQ